MKKSHHAIGFLIATIIILVACSKKENASILLPELTQAEAVMYDYPDSALKILQNMQVPPAKQKLQNATWALLMTQAKYRIFMDQSDSLINIAYCFFTTQEDPQRKTLVLYLKGCIYHDNNNIEEAQKQFIKAADIVEKTNDNRLAYLIYLHLGDIYIYRHLNTYALQAFEKSYQHALKTNNKIIIVEAILRLGRVYTVQKEYAKAIEYYTKSIKLAESIDNKSIYGRCLNELSTIYTQTENYDLAIQYIKKAIQITNEINIPEQYYLSLGDIYRNTKQADSAYYFLNKALISTNIYTLRSTYQALFYLSKEEQDYKKTAFYSEKLWSYQDSIQKLDQSKELAEVQEKYNQQKVINEKNQLEIEKDRNTRNTLIALTFFLCAIAVLIYIYQHKLIRKERTIQKKEDEIRRKTIKISENGLLIRRNQLRMEELMNQIDANKDMQEQLEELNKTYHEIFQQNEMLSKENQTLQKNIDKYASSLDAQSEELRKLNVLTEENQRLHDREKNLCTQLVKNTKILNSLLNNPKYIETVQWKAIEEAVNMIFDNFTIRLSRKISSLTEYELHLCCLIKLGMNNSSIANAMGIAPTSVSKQKFRLKERIMQQVDTPWESSSLDLWIWDF